MTATTQHEKQNGKQGEDMATTASAITGTAAPDAAAILERVRFNDDGLFPAIIQQHDSREVLMLGWMDAEALTRTLTEGRVTFWSRSRREYWRKGDTSGHAQYVKQAALDCDGDTLLVEVEQIGAACHTGDRTCFDADVLDPVIGAPSASAASPERPEETA